MEFINFYNIKAEKANAIRKYRQRRRIGNFLRFMEICFVLALISRFWTQLPSAVKNSGEYFRFLSVTLISPGFVFVIGNAIVLTLFAKSGQCSGSDPGKINSTSGTDSCEEFIKNSEKNPKTRIIDTDDRTGNLATDYDAHSFKKRKNYQRSQSDNSGSVEFHHENRLRELRRSETERGHLERIDSGEKPGESSFYAEDKMSNEEFRRMVEAFIARQQRFRMEEGRVNKNKYFSATSVCL